LRILTLDIETKPHTVLTWSLHGEQHIALNQIVAPGGVICFAAKWHGEKKVLFYSDYHDGHAAMVQAAHDLISEADAIVTYNGRSFDLKHLRWEMELLGLGPASPWKDIDLYTTVRSTFKAASNKLDFISDQLGIGSKVQHAGMPLWRGVMADDPAAWKLMRRYNMQDVVLTEQLYDRLLPSIRNHPNVNLYKRERRTEVPEGQLDSCPKCGTPGLQKRGAARTLTATYQRWFCASCRGWSRSTQRDDATYRVSAA
jgi:DNA polymerase elongation subunit (family B)